MRIREVCKREEAVGDGEVHTPTEKKIKMLSTFLSSEAMFDPGWASSKSYIEN